MKFQFILEEFLSAKVHLPVDKTKALGKSLVHLLENLNDTTVPSPDKHAFIENFRNECTDILEGTLPWRVAIIIGKIAIVIVATLAGVLLGSILGLLVGMGAELCLGGMGAGTVGATIFSLVALAVGFFAYELTRRQLFPSYQNSIEMIEVDHFANMADVKSTPVKYKFFNPKNDQKVEPDPSTLGMVF